MERLFALRGHKKLFPDDDYGDGFVTDQRQEQSVLWFLFFSYREQNSYLQKTSIHQQNKLVIIRVLDSPCVLPKLQRSVPIFSPCPFSRCYTFGFRRLK